MPGDNGNGSQPSPTEPNGNGKDASGKFIKGNRFGKGNPHQQSVHRFRSILLDSSTDKRVNRLIRLLWAKGLKGEQWAMQELLNRLYGKPKETIKVESTEEPGDAFDYLRDEETRLVLTRANRRRQESGQVAGPGSSSG